MASIPVENNCNPPSQGAMQTACPLVQTPAIVTPLASALPPIDTNPFFNEHHRHHHLLLHRDHGVVPCKSMDDKKEGELDSEDKKLPDGSGREHKKRSKNWTRAETLKLIKLRSEMQDKFSKAGKKGELWEQIASGLQRDHFTRDAQQCRDKWEKLLAAYKEVRDGHKEKEDYPFYEELHLLLSGRSTRKEKDHHHHVVSSGSDHGAGGEMRRRMQDDNEDEDDGNEDDEDAKYGTWTKGVCKEDREPLWALYNRCSAMSMEGGETEMMRSSLKRKQRSYPPTEQLEPIHSIRTLLETVMSCQQKIFEGFLESFQRRKEQRDRMREEREERWRAEERAQSLVFNNAVLLLLQKLIEDKTGPMDRSSNSPSSMDHQHQHQHQHHHQQEQQEEELQEQQQQLLVAKRSKNWKRSEVLELIRLCATAKMEGVLISRAAKCSAAWDELSDALAALGIKRDGKQCCEKWEKLMSGYREVMAGRREPSESPYFQELTRAIGSKTS